MIEYPWVCVKCRKLNMINLLNPESRILNKIITEEGFTCTGCKTWNTTFYITQSLTDAMLRLERMDTRRQDFRQHFGKVLRKAEGVRQKAEG